MPNVIQKLYDRLYPKAPVLELSTSDSQTEAQKAVQSAEVAYNTAVGKNAEISHVVSALRSQRERNHFAELLEATMRGNG